MTAEMPAAVAIPQFFVGRPVAHRAALAAAFLLAAAAPSPDPAEGLPPRVTLEARSPEARLLALLFRFGAPAGEGTAEAALRGHLNGFCKFAGSATKLPAGHVDEALSLYGELGRAGRLAERPEWSRAMGDAVRLPASVERLEITVDPALPCLYAPRRKRTIRVLTLGLDGQAVHPEEAALALAHEGAHLRREASGNAYEGNPAMKGRVDPNAHAPDELGTEESATEEGYALYREMLTLARLRGAEGEREVEARFAVKAVRESSHPIRRFEPGYLLQPGETEEVRVIPIGEASLAQCLRCEGIVARILFELGFVRNRDAEIEGALSGNPGKAIKWTDWIAFVRAAPSAGIDRDAGLAVDIAAGFAATTAEIEALVGSDYAKTRHTSHGPHNPDPSRMPEDTQR